MEDVYNVLVTYIPIKTARLVCKKWEKIANLNISLYHVTDQDLKTLGHMNIVSISSPYLSEIPYMESLHTLDITSCTLNVNHLTNLTQLNISKSEVVDIFNLTNLIELDLGFNYKIRSITMLTNLISLNLEDTTNVSNLDTLINLEYLQLGFGNKVKNVSHLTNLTLLDLCFASSVKGMEKLVNLETLYLPESGGKFDLRTLTNLTQLDNHLIR